ncbi:dUTPase, partial [Listeria monocytogenes]|nr:dUTPase [Listeria monocytogenes]
MNELKVRGFEVVNEASRKFP